MPNPTAARRPNAIAAPFRTRAARWAAVLARRAEADTAFVYAVRTTGIYCRASCPSRRPKATNVDFFSDPDAAETAGYRACLRCQPRSPPAASRQAALFTQLCRRIESAEVMPTLAELAQQAGLSRFHLLRQFRAVVGLTPREYGAQQRRARLAQSLGSAPSVTAAMHAAGYGSSGPFYGEANAVLGMTPRQFRSGGSDETIQHATSRCALGNVLVAATARGLCAILLGDDPALLRADLAKRFPAATLQPASRPFAAQLRAVVAHIKDPGQPLALPLDIRGTAFQQRVWKALRDIPAGRTASYTQIARAIKAPRAVRAVAQACGANPLAVAIPCHRVLRSDGALSGYRWGIERKRELLRRESAGG